MIIIGESDFHWASIRTKHSYLRQVWTLRKTLTACLNFVGALNSLRTFRVGFVDSGFFWNNLFLQKYMSSQTLPLDLSRILARNNQRSFAFSATEKFCCGDLWNDADFSEALWNSQRTFCFCPLPAQLCSFQPSRSVAEVRKRSKHGVPE